MTTLLSGGVTWRSNGPVLSLHEVPPAASSPSAESGTHAEPSPVEDTTDVVLGSGTVLAWEITAAGRYCLGFHRVHGRDDRTWTRCADQAPAQRGHQCSRCFAQDDFRFMHDVHRSGIAPTGLKRYLDQPHWLYVATFADGATKVGTASHPRKRARLVEQGAVVAQYVAHARDGLVVRVLEDEVTRAVGLQQAVRSGAKAASLLEPLAHARLEHINDGFALAARGLLGSGLDIDGFEVVHEEFRPPSSWAAVLGRTGLQPYPGSLADGRHGFTVVEVLGPSMVVMIDGSDVRFVADLAQLRGRRLRLGDFRTTVPAVQEALF